MIAAISERTEDTVLNLSQEVEMLTAELSEMSANHANEVKLRKEAHARLKVADEALKEANEDTKKVAREARKIASRDQNLRIENQKLREIVDRIGGGALKDIEKDLKASEEGRWNTVVELERLRRYVLRLIAKNKARPVFDTM